MYILPISRLFCFPFPTLFLRLSEDTGVTFMRGLMIMRALGELFSDLKSFPGFHSFLGVFILTVIMSQILMHPCLSPLLAAQAQPVHCRG